MRKNKTPIPRTIKSIWRTPYIDSIDIADHYSKVFSDKLLSKGVMPPRT
jgi:hypothetical protein